MRGYAHMSDVTARAQVLYRLATSDADWSAEEVRDRFEWTDDDLAASIQLLADLRLMKPAPDTPSGWACFSPESALNNLLSEERRRMAQLISGVEQNQAALTQLLMDFQPIHASKLATVQMELVRGGANVGAALGDLAGRVQGEVFSLHPGKAPQAELMEAGLERDRLALQRGVRMRTIHLTSAAAVPHMSAYLRSLVEAGAEVRTMHTLPVRMIIIDRAEAVVPAPSTDGQPAALLIRSELLVQVLCQIFDYCWTAAAQIGPERGDDGDLPVDDVQAALSPRHHELVRMLASGLTDDMMSRKLGLSERTVRRMVMDITTALGTDSRFQTGVRISQLGWLD